MWSTNAAYFLDFLFSDPTLFDHGAAVAAQFRQRKLAFHHRNVSAINWHCITHINKWSNPWLTYTSAGWRDVRGQTPKLTLLYLATCTEWRTNRAVG